MILNAKTGTININGIEIGKQTTLRSIKVFDKSIIKITEYKDAAMVDFVEAHELAGQKMWITLFYMKQDKIPFILLCPEATMTNEPYARTMFRASKNWLQIIVSKDPSINKEDKIKYDYEWGKITCELQNDILDEDGTDTLYGGGVEIKYYEK